MVLIVIRHGESEADILDVHEGRADFELTQKGHRRCCYGKICSRELSGYTYSREHAQEGGANCEASKTAVQNCMEKYQIKAIDKSTKAGFMGGILS